MMERRNWQSSLISERQAAGLHGLVLGHVPGADNALLAQTVTIEEAATDAYGDARAGLIGTPTWLAPELLRVPRIPSGP